MNITYDQGTDVLTVRFHDAPVCDRHEDKPGIHLGYDAAGQLVLLTIAQASRQTTIPHGVDYVMTMSRGGTTHQATHQHHSTTHTQTHSSTTVFQSGPAPGEPR